MQLEEASKMFQIPVNVLEWLVKDGIISNPVDEEEIHGLAIIRAFCAKEKYVKWLLKGYRKPKRVMMCLFPEYNKAELYILNTYLNLPAGEKLDILDVAQNVKHNYGFWMPHEKIKRIRRVAYDIRGGRRGRFLDKWVLEKLAGPHSAPEV